MLLMSCLLRRVLVCGMAFGVLATTSVAHAQDDTTWQAVRKAGVLRCGVALGPPYVMKDPNTGTYSGVFPELCRDFAEKVLKVKIAYVDTTWDNIVAGLQSDKWDVALSLNDTPERRKAISFTEPVMDFSVTFAYNKNNPKLPKSFSTLSDVDKPGMIVAVMSGTAQDKAISAVLKQATIMRLPGFDETRLALMAKRADLLADDNMTNLMLTRAHPDWAVAFQPNPPLASQGINFGIRKDTPAADVAVFNQFIEKQKQDGMISRYTDTAIKETLAQGK